MNSIIILVSYHHNNTEKIAKAIATTLGAEILTLDQTDPNSLQTYDLIGFGSGVYFGKLDKGLLGLADKLPVVNNKKAFVFSTSGRGGKSAEGFHKSLKEKLVPKGYAISGEFSCPGFDTYGVLKLSGGVKKGRPNAEDLKQAESFGQKLKNGEQATVFID